VRVWNDGGELRVGERVDALRSGRQRVAAGFGPQGYSLVKLASPEQR
jgi:hypothetical protein